MVYKNNALNKLGCRLFKNYALIGNNVMEYVKPVE